MVLLLDVEVNMSESLVEKLLGSFDELEKCITVTKQVLAEKEGVPEDVVLRVNQYSDIVTKQRGLAHELRQHLDNQNWDEVGRRVRLINGLSTMIRDDAQAILATAGSAEMPQLTEHKKEFIL